MGGRNRIVVNYGEMEDLVLLGSVDNDIGYYAGPVESAAYIEYPGPVTETFDYSSVSDALGHMGRDNSEGYVVRSHNFMVKIKEPAYLDLHRLVTNMTSKSIWEKLKAGRSVEQICADLPDEFHSMAEGFAIPLREAYNKRLEEILDGFGNAMGKVNPNATRKEYAKVFTKHKDAKYYFSLLDRKPINELLWNELRPKEAAVDSAKTIL